MGLAEAPENKLKISNFMKSLVNDAVQDPTMIERGVKKQVKERSDAHNKRNTVRKLTAEERKARKHKKLTEDTTKQTHVAVFKVNDLSSRKNRYKVDVSASENNFTGCVIHSGYFSLVVV